MARLVNVLGALPHNPHVVVALSLLVAILVKAPFSVVPHPPRPVYPPCQTLITTAVVPVTLLVNDGLLVLMFTYVTPPPASVIVINPSMSVPPVIGIVIAVPALRLLKLNVMVFNCRIK